MVSEKEPENKDAGKGRKPTIPMLVAVGFGMVAAAGTLTFMLIAGKPEDKPAPPARESPLTLCINDFNEDGLEDISVRGSHIEDYILLSRNDGTYIKVTEGKAEYRTKQALENLCQ